MKTMSLIILSLIISSTYGQDNKYEADADYNVRIGKYEEAYNAIKHFCVE